MIKDKACGSSKLTFKSVKLILLCVFVLSVFKSNGQVSVHDSLLTLINKQRKAKSFSKKDTSYIKLITRLSYELRYYKADSSLALSKQALKYSKSANYKVGEIKALMGLGFYHSDKGNYEKSISYFKQALHTAKNINSVSLELDCLSRIASQYSYLGNDGKALDGYLECIEIASRIQDKFMLSILNENIAGLYSDQKDFDEAMVYYKKTKKINEELGNPIYSAETMSNMASAYADMGELEYAMYNVNSSIVIFEEKRILDWLAYAYEVKGKVYLKQKKFNWALYWYKQSEMLHEQLEDDRAEISLLNGMAEAYLGLNKDNTSKPYAIKAYNLAKKINDKDGIVECANTLYKINKNRNDFKTALVYHEIYQEYSDSLNKNKNRKGLTMLKTKIEHEKQKEELILANEEALTKQKVYVYISLTILLVFIGLTLFIRRNERIQTDLNVELKSKTEKLEVSEKELKEINTTKDRLFSIIGHDLRGPIGAFQGLLKLFKDGEMSKEEFLGFVPKLRKDIDNISFTLNNLLSWGHTQMNGATTKPSLVSIDELVNENVNLLSEVANNKSITLINNIPLNTVAWSDNNQIDIVVRNLLSNAIKFTPENGIITIGAVQRVNHWEISVKDTGIGMDEKTQKQIFENNSTYTTYGTNEEKGTGLGLNLCKEMVEKNKGKLWAESSLNKGSCFYFTVPKGKRSFKKIA